MKYPLVSIIIPMYNAESTIAECIESLLRLRYPKDKLEIVIVDNGSTDQSVSVVKKYPVRLLSKPIGTIAAVRNFGASHSNGEIYGFVDSDCLVFEDWLISALKQLQNNDVAATGSGYLAPANCTWVEKAWLYESKHKPFQTDFITSGNFIIKSKVFNEIGGYNEKLKTCEDADICVRIIQKGYKVINSSEIKIVHLGNPKTISEFVRKELWYGEDMLSATRIGYVDKVFVMTLLFFLTHLGLLMGVIQLTLYKNLYFFGSFSLFLILILLFSTFYRVRRSKKYSFILHTAILYYFYFTARAAAIITYRLKRYFKYIKSK